MTITRIGVGPRMSQAVIHGDTVYLAGQVADNPVPSVGKQTKQILRQIDKLLLADDRWIGASAASVAQVEQAARDSGCAVLRLGSSAADTAATLTERVVAALAENAPESALRRS